MIVLSLDIASKTGWSLLEDSKLLDYGLISYKIKTNEYPWGIYSAAKENAELIFNQVLLLPQAEVVIIERTNSPRGRNSQNFLEYVHAFLLQKFDEAGLAQKVIYMNSGTWRKKVGLVMSKEDKKHNKARRASKKVVGGIITKKHLAVRLANEVFGLSLIQKDDDLSDSLLLALAYFK